MAGSASRESGNLIAGREARHQETGGARAPPAAKRERRLRRFVVAAMLNPFTLPALGASVLVAIALGVHLGESSVGLINPIYFQGPPLHPRDRGAAIEEGSLHRSQTAYADLYGWEQGHAARAAGPGSTAGGVLLPPGGGRGDASHVPRPGRMMSKGEA